MKQRHQIADATSCPPSCQRSLWTCRLLPSFELRLPRLSPPFPGLSVRTAISRQDRLQVLSRPSVASLARRILVASFSPVNPARDFFLDFLLAFAVSFGFRSRLCVNNRCGEEGTRTPDLLLAKQALYQLSYFPASADVAPSVSLRVRVLGFEPRTSALSELRSSQLSYTRNPNLSSLRRVCVSQPHQTRRPNRSWFGPIDSHSVPGNPGDPDSSARLSASRRNQDVSGNRNRNHAHLTRRSCTVGL